MPATLKRAIRGDRSPAGERFTDRKKIVAILHRLKADHELLGVTVPGCGDGSNTAILGIREKQGCFFLDELNSRTAHEAFLNSRKARVDCRLQGTELSFTVHLLKASTANGIALYELALPKTVMRLQRRESFRLRLSPALSIPVTLAHFEGETVNGEALDLSAGGVGVFLHTRNIPSRGQILHSLSISMPRSRPFRADIEVRFAQLEQSHHMLRVGGRFVDLNPAQERQIAQFLAEQQRKLRRHGPR
ncbi:MAG: flagellar brake protein [Thiogranum sp.]